MEILLNRWRGTGGVFFPFGYKITGTMLYALYIGLLFGFLTTWYIGLISLALFLLGESMGWGKWIGYLTTDNHPENYNDKEGYNFPFIHQTANLIANEKEHYRLYCQLALGLRGFYWWILPYLFMAFIDLISYYEAVLFSILLGVLFPLACEIGKRLDYNGKFWIVNYSKGWENQELIYGLFQGLFFNYVIITNIINRVLNG